MVTKTSLKVISLYDIIVDNILLLLAFFHHIIILMFNNWSIKHLETLKVQFILYSKNFLIIQQNLEFCQNITLLCMVVILLVPSILKINNININSNIYKKEINNSYVFIMFIGFICKVLYTLINYKDVIDILTINDKFFGTEYSLIIISYLVRYLPLLFGLASSLFIFTMYLLSELVNKLIIFLKNFKIEYIEQKYINENNV